MKKAIAIMMLLCILGTALCIGTSALTVSSDDVIRIYGLKKNRSTVLLDGSGSFEDGWEMAVDYAEDHSYMDENGYERIVVDLLADWNANEYGEFGSSRGDGFQYSTIYVPSDTRITINMNGHTINRGLREYEYDGEVICINDNADVIINGGKSGDPIIQIGEDANGVKMGTITGGWSCNGAGGIHMQDGSKLTLNNVNVDGNCVEDDDGAGIAVYDGATLTMNGGSVSRNTSYSSSLTVYGGGVYIDEASAYFTDVTFQDNQGIGRSTHGAVVYVNDGTLVMDRCKVVGNGLNVADDGTARRVAYSIMDISRGSKVTLKETQFLENGDAAEIHFVSNTLKYTTIISSTASYLTMEKCKFNNNYQVYLIESDATILKAKDSDFTENHSFAFYGNCAGEFSSTFINCRFSYNEPMLNLDDTFFFNIFNAGLSFVDCDFGGATFHNPDAVTFLNSNGEPDGAGSIFSEGSLTMIVASLALVASAVSICLTVAYHKKKAVPMFANGAAESDDEE